MSEAKRDQNFVTTETGLLNTDGVTPINLAVDPTTHALMISKGTTDAFLPPGELIVSQPTGDQSVPLSSTLTGVGQSFLGEGSTLGSVVFNARKLNSPTGTAYAKIYAHSGTFGTSSVPTGVALAVSDGVDVSDISASFDVLTPHFRFSGVNQITLTSGTPYVLTLEFTPTAGTFLAPLNSLPTSVGPGNFSFFSSGSWTSQTFDLVFYLYNNVASVSLTNAIRDGNFVPTLMGVSSADGVTPIPILVDSSGNLLVQST